MLSIRKLQKCANETCIKPQKDRLKSSQLGEQCCKISQPVKFVGCQFFQPSKFPQLALPFFNNFAPNFLLFEHAPLNLARVHRG